jgi:hypothetical protein
MDRKEMFGRARFFKAADLPTPKVATIAYVTMERLRDPNGGGENEKPVVTFSDDPRQLVLNATNYDAISDFSGLWNTDDWQGLRIELCAATDTNQKGEEYQWVKAREAPEPAAVEAGDPGNVSKLPVQRPAPRHAPKPARDDMNDEVPF